MATAPLEQYRADLSTRQDPQRLARTLLALGQIPMAAADAIVEVMERDNLPPEVLRAAISSLAWQRDPRAAPTLRALLARTADPKLSAVITTALRFLE